jgi:hypothetical protein
MQSEQFSSVLETVGRLIRDYGNRAAQEAMLRAMTSEEHGDRAVQTFWLEVLAETIDAVIVVGLYCLGGQSEDPTVDCSDLLDRNLMLPKYRTYQSGYSLGAKRCSRWPYWKMTSALNLFWRNPGNGRQSEMSWGIADAIADQMLRLTPEL